MRHRLTCLWRHPDFTRLWAAQTVSVFGSLVTRTALPFVAILVLDASPFQIATLGLAELVPGFLVGLFAGVWVDRLRRRPIMIAADLGRAVLVLVIPALALFDALQMVHLYIVAVLVSVLTIFFDVAYQSYLPSLVSREELVEGNSKLTASSSVAEFAAFSSGGWLVQWLTAPYAMIVDAATFVWSAAFVLRIRAQEPEPAPAHERQHALREIAEGLKFLLRNATLRALAWSSVIFAVAVRITGTVFLLYVTRDLGFHPGLLGVIFSVGGITSLIGALIARRTAERLGIGPAMIWSLVIVGVGNAVIALATDSSWIAIGILILQQMITDPAWTVLEISQMSLRQSITPDRWQGRTNGSLRFIEFGGMLIGALLGGWLGGAVGLRTTLLISSAGCLVAALPLVFSSIRGLRVVAVPAVEMAALITEVP